MFVRARVVARRGASVQARVRGCGSVEWVRGGAGGGHACWRVRVCLFVPLLVWHGVVALSEEGSRGLMGFVFTPIIDVDNRVREQHEHIIAQPCLNPG